MPPDSSDFLDSDFDDGKIRDALDTSKPKGVLEDQQKGKYKCSIEGCNMTFKRMTCLDRHEYAHTGRKKHTCIVEGCDKKYIILEHLKRHVARFHEKKFPPKVFPCSEESCKLKFRSMWDMEKHFKTAHENLKPHICPECHEGFRRKMQLRKHMIKHTGEYPYKCNQCGQGFLLAIGLKRHECSSYECKQCKISFPKWSELCAHHKENNCIWPKCEVCSKKFKKQFILQEHMKSHQSEDERVVYPCTYEGCERFYFYPKNLDAHVKSFHEKLKFKCTYDGCAKELCSKKTLEKHIQIFHTSTGTGSSKPAKAPKNRARRKDFGKRKVAMASVLSGITVDRIVTEMLVNGEGDQIETSEIEIVTPQIPEDSIEIMD